MMKRYSGSKRPGPKTPSEGRHVVGAASSKKASNKGRYY